ncbi:hypothetical protein [Streptomyces sp. NBC_01197]|uniref:hypothetical protein n=1 Tax=Streptomyces sp. NBC_01197 TaxID=2903768 RepID=UPI002E0E7B08|nr:hypothetical protein OG452_05330 [Streptomyces sp. NBC_01197]
MSRGITFTPGWEDAMFSTLECGALVAEVAERIRIAVIREAPRNSSTHTNWNQIKKNITASVERDARGYYGEVTIEENDKVRHALLQDRGWTDRAGRHHKGLQYMKEALLRERIE